MNKIFKNFTDKIRSVVIACNTLQLWIDKIDDKYKKNIKIYTTFEASSWFFKKNKNKPLWLGTTPLVEQVKEFPTLLTFREEEAQNKVQELIWRIKMFYGDDITTAFDYVKKDMSLSKKKQKQKIFDLKKTIIFVIKKLRINKVILGCTELPIIFKPIENHIKFFDPAEILVDYIKNQN